MSRLRERTNCFNVIGDSEGVEIPKNGRWLNIMETDEGGAVIEVQTDDPDYLLTNDLECFDRLNQKLGVGKGRIIEAIVNEKEDKIILVDEKGAQIPFEEVMKAIEK